jgi:branched-chain amino acid transport system permease protein
MAILPFVISGLGVGAVYALSGIGLTLLFRATGTINFAFGALGALAAHAMWSMERAGVNGLLAALIAVGAVGVISVAYGLGVAIRLSSHSTSVRSVATLGLTLILLGAMGAIWGETPRRLGLPTDGFSISLFGAKLNGTRMVALLLVILSVAFLAVFFKRTRTGLLMRAVANDQDLSAILGVRTTVVQGLSWLLCGIFGGVAGILLANIVRLQPSFLTFLIIPAVATALAARLSSVTVAALAGVGIGIVEAGLSAFPEAAPYRSVAPYIIALALTAIAPLNMTGEAAR